MKAWVPGCKHVCMKKENINKWYKKDGNKIIEMRNGYTDKLK